MFLFLSSASGAYLKHFTPELRALSSRCGLDVPLSSLGPAVIIFQETTHTQLLGHGRGGKYTKWHEYTVCDHKNTPQFYKFFAFLLDVFLWVFISCSVGPAVKVIYLLLLSLADSKVGGQADTLLQKRFHDLGLGTEAFSSVQYVGTQTITPPTDYNRLLEAIRQQVKNTHTRSPRQPGIVFHALEVIDGSLPPVLNRHKVKF